MTTTHTADLPGLKKTARLADLQVVADEPAWTCTPDRLMEISGQHACSLQRHLLRHHRTTAARAAAIITDIIHRMAGVPMTEEGTAQ